MPTNINLVLLIFEMERHRTLYLLERRASEVGGNEISNGALLEVRYFPYECYCGTVAFSVSVLPTLCSFVKPGALPILVRHYSSKNFSETFCL